MVTMYTTQPMGNLKRVITLITLYSFVFSVFSTCLLKIGLTAFADCARLNFSLCSVVTCHTSKRGRQKIQYYAMYTEINV